MRLHPQVIAWINKKEFKIPALNLNLKIKFFKFMFVLYFFIIIYYLLYLFILIIRACKIKREVC